jgi:hypothetical protein
MPIPSADSKLSKQLKLSPFLLQPFAENCLRRSYAKAMPMSPLLALRTHGLPSKALFVARERLRQRFGKHKGEQKRELGQKLAPY